MPSSQPDTKAHGRHWGSMYALGTEGPPPHVSLNGRRFELEQLVKHDFWAATCFYLDSETGQRAVIKFGRTRRLGLLPMRWAGRFLVERESGFYHLLEDVPAVPRWLGKLEPPLIGFVHEYVDGEPISRANSQRLGEEFFASLSGVLDQLHQRSVAYVDLHKETNIIVDAAGLPHLIDFQISYYIDGGPMRRLLPRPLRRWLFSLGARADRYHLLKHKIYRRPDLLDAQDLQRVQRRIWFIRLHRRVAAPYLFVRRRLLKRWRSSGRLLPEGPG